MLHFKTGWPFGSTCLFVKNRLYRTFTKNSVTFVLFHVYIIERQKSEDVVKGQVWKKCYLNSINGLKLAMILLFLNWPILLGRPFLDENRRVRGILHKFYEIICNFLASFTSIIVDRSSRLLGIPFIKLEKLGIPSRNVLTRNCPVSLGGT